MPSLGTTADSSRSKEFSNRNPLSFLEISSFWIILIHYASDMEKEPSSPSSSSGGIIIIGLVERKHIPVGKTLDLRGCKDIIIIGI